MLPAPSVSWAEEPPARNVRAARYATMMQAAETNRALNAVRSGTDSATGSPETA